MRIEGLRDMTPFENRRRPMAHAFATELGDMLDRAGGVGKAKHAARFRERMRSERRLKHRLTLLTVLRLTTDDIFQELLHGDMFDILLRWIKEGMLVSTVSCIRFVEAVLKLLIDKNVTPKQNLDDWNVSLLQLQRSKNTPLNVLAQKLDQKWKMADGIIKTVELLESPKKSCCDSICLDGISKIAEFQTDIQSDESSSGSKRVEGLNTPLPRAFYHKTLQNTISGRIFPKSRKSQKRVHWAPNERLVSIRYFRPSDPPNHLCNDPLIERDWYPPVRIVLDDAWQVKMGDQSEEKKFQEEREKRVMPLDPANMIEDAEPELPYYRDTVPDLQHRPVDLPLEPPKKQTAVSTPPVQIEKPMNLTMQNRQPWIGYSFVLPTGSVWMPPVLMGSASLPVYAQQSSSYFVVPQTNANSISPKPPSMDDPERRFG